MINLVSDDSVPDDSDTDSLPDLSQIFKKSQTSSDISRGDIVWAKFKHLYWPALVRTVYPKQKKISIWYADDPGKTFKLPLRNVCRFNDSTMVAKIKEDVIQAGCVQEHEGLTSHAMRYLIRRKEGYKDDPMKFFDQTYPFFVVEEWLQKHPSDDFSNIKIPPLYISHEKKQSIRKRVHSCRDVSDDSEVESTDSESMQGEKFSTTDYLTEVNIQLRDNPSDPSKDEYLEKIVECILSGEADDYLQKIMSKNIPSEHHDIYEKSVKDNKKNLSKITYTGPIEDDDKLRRVIFYLLPLYINMCGRPRSKQGGTRKLMKAVSSCPSLDAKSEGAQYVASVWLPESIIFAISVIKKVSLDDAKQLFNEKSESKTKAVESILASLGTLSPKKGITDATFKLAETSLSQDDSENHHETLQHSSDNKKAPLSKKMRVNGPENVKNNGESISKNLWVSLETSESSSDLKSVNERKHISRSDNGVEQYDSFGLSKVKSATVPL